MKRQEIVRKELVLSGQVKEDAPVVSATASYEGGTLVIRDSVGDDVEIRFSNPGEALNVANAAKAVADYMEARRVERAAS